MGARRDTRSASFPASRDRYAGLTGPAIKDAGSVAPMRVRVPVRSQAGPDPDGVAPQSGQTAWLGYSPDAFSDLVSRLNRGW